MKYRLTNDVMSYKVLHAQIMTTKIFKTFLILCGITDIKTMHKTNKFHLAVRVYSDNAHRTSKRGKNMSHD